MQEVFLLIHIFVFQSCLSVRLILIHETDVRSDPLLRFATKSLSYHTHSMAPSIWSVPFVLLHRSSVSKIKALSKPLKIYKGGVLVWMQMTNNQISPPLQRTLIKIYQQKKKDLNRCLNMMWDKCIVTALLDVLMFICLVYKFKPTSIIKWAKISHLYKRNKKNNLIVNSIVMVVG